ncbi:hypothetical protein PR048_016884 [Dryococelus australis]|uniref:Uncharacterized protein n=1 Tax=Dryococelus australis TaxID=614101 RepID=A0ABQ9H7Z7_9NEOP|nr:hypothetical protein PR048_016884 [Dryococelus australis]
MQVSTCERYDPATDCWESVRPLPLYCTQHAGASWGKTKLYISGGLAHDTVHSMLYCYDRCSGSWTILQPMRTPRADHVMITIGDK